MSKWKGPPHEDIPRCRARTRSGGCCGHYSMKNGRCRYHGGKSSGAKEPVTKHGLYTQAAIAQKKTISKLIGQSRQLLEEF